MNDEYFEKYYDCTRMCSNKNYANIDYYYENSTNYQNVSISNTSYSNYTSGSNVTNISNFESKPKIKLEMKYLLYIYEGKNNALDLLNDDIKSVVLKAYTCLGNSGLEKNSSQNHSKNVDMQNILKKMILIHVSNAYLVIH